MKASLLILAALFATAHARADGTTTEVAKCYVEHSDYIVIIQKFVLGTDTVYKAGILKKDMSPVAIYDNVEVTLPDETNQYTYTFNLPTQFNLVFNRNFIYGQPFLAGNVDAISAMGVAIKGGTQCGLTR